MFLLLLSCTKQAPDDSHVTVDTGELTNAPVEVTISSCAEPLLEVSYTDNSEMFGSIDTYDDWPLNGPIAIARNQTDWVGVNIIGTWRTSHWGSTIEPFEVSWSEPIQRLTSVELNGNMTDEIVVMGEAVDILYDGGSEPVRLIDPAGFSTHREAIAMDWCGDSNTDLLIVRASQEEDPGSGGTVFIGGDDGLQSETIQIAPGADEWGRVFDITPIDWDNDGDMDLYICNDFGSSAGGNGVLINNGDCSFESGDADGADIAIDCMSSSFGDLNGDSEFDIFAAAADNHHLLMHSSGGFYEANGTISGATMTGDQMGWGSQIIDYDNDGLNDILVSTSDFTEADAGVFPIQLLRQSSDGMFIEIGEELGLPQEAGGRGLIARDLNQDGVLDFVIADFMRPSWLITSDGCTSNGWLSVNAPEGTRVEVTTDLSSHLALVTGGPGFAASMPPQAHIGVGNGAIERVKLTRPNLPAEIVEPNAPAGSGVIINYTE